MIKQWSQLNPKLNNYMGMKTNIMILKYKSTNSYSMVNILNMKLNKYF